MCKRTYNLYYLDKFYILLYANLIRFRFLKNFPGIVKLPTQNKTDKRFVRKF